MRIVYTIPIPRAYQKSDLIFKFGYDMDIKFPNLYIDYSFSICISFKWMNIEK